MRWRTRRTRRTGSKTSGEAVDIRRRRWARMMRWRSRRRQARSSSRRGAREVNEPSPIAYGVVSKA